MLEELGPVLLEEFVGGLGEEWQRLLAAWREILDDLERDPLLTVALLERG